VGKNVAVFVDVANIFYAAKAAGVDIDYVTLLKSATAGRDFVRAYAYTGLDPENENQRNFHQFLARHSYKVVSKDIRKYGDGRVKANLDIELVVDMMKTARNLDVAVIVSGDGDFASAIRAVQEMGVRVEVISFRGNTSSDLIEAADLFMDITQIAKVDKSSTRSGRRVADDDEDLSMTEVPEKQSEGTGRGRGRGRGRSRTDRDETPVAASRSGRGTARSAAVAPAATAGPGAPGSGAPGLVALPGERLSRAAAAAAPVEAPDDDAQEQETVESVEGDALAETGDAHRRRRRRGGRGRGRGRRDGLETGADDAVVDAEGPEAADAGDAQTAETEPEAAPRAPRATRAARPARPAADGELPTPFDDIDALAPSRPAPRSTPFGSVWDRQLGTPTARPAASGLTPLPDDDEDFEEPEIPEYLITEQRRGNQGRGGQGRGGQGRGGARGAYAAAIERERYGGGRGAGVNRFAEQPVRRSGGSGGGGRSQQPSRGPRPERQDRPDRFERAPRSGGGSEPWSEVPPEVEELLRAQLAQSRPQTAADTAAATPEAEPAREAPKRRTTRRKAAETAEPATEPAAEAPKRRTTRRTATATADTAAATPEAEPAGEAPKRRTTRRKAAETAEG
jgi:uncharacterized LabA/DUF88 family protein